MFFAASFLPGCQTPAVAQTDRGHRVARVVGDFIVAQPRLPSSQAEPIANANTVSDRAAIRALRTVSFQAVGPSVARVEFSDSRGISDYRTVVISARRPPRPTREDESLPTSVFTDPNVLFVFSH